LIVIDAWELRDGSFPIQSSLQREEPEGTGEALRIEGLSQELRGKPESGGKPRSFLEYRLGILSCII
jgi:hypothetical protein